MPSHNSQFLQALPATLDSGRTVACVLLLCSVEDGMIVKIVPNDRDAPPDKVADVELVFEEGVLSGLRLTGFSIWQNRKGRAVTVPTRAYFVHGERRTYALLRPMNDEGSIEPLRRLILDSYAEFEQRMALAS